MIDYTLPLEQLPDPLPIRPLQRPFNVTITPPGSKSITCRAYVLAALAEGTSKIIRPLKSDDTDTLLKALCTLGAEAKWVPGRGEDASEDVFITGVGGRFPHGGDLYMGEGGAPTRFMIACACLAMEPVTIDASPRMRERPIAEGVEMLRALGAKIEYVEEDGRLPVRVSPSEAFRGGTLKVGKTASSQFISAVMLIAPWLDDGITLALDSPTSASYIALTRRTIKQFGGNAKQNFLGQFSEAKLRRMEIPNDPISACSFNVEADASSALYWALAAMLCLKSLYTIQGIGNFSRQPDIHAIETVAQLGGSVDFFDADDYQDGNPDCGAIRGPKKLGTNTSFHNDCSEFPDGSVASAVAAAWCAKPSCLTGLQTLRHKETDRLAALQSELTKVGCEVETGEDWIKITPMPRDEHGKLVRTDPVIIDTYNDHRMAMAFAVLGLARPGISIRNPACVAKSYPGFWKDFALLYATPASGIL